MRQGIKKSRNLLYAAFTSANFRIACDENVTLTIVGWTPSEMMVVPFDGDNDDKPWFFSMVREMFQEHGVLEYFAIAESWTYAGKEGDEYGDKIKSGEMCVSDLPEDVRGEAVIFAHVDRNGVLGMWSSKIDRQRKCVEHPEEMNFDQASGNVLELLRQEGGFPKGADGEVTKKLH